MKILTEFSKLNFKGCEIAIKNFLNLVYIINSSLSLFLTWIKLLKVNLQDKKISNSAIYQYTRLPRKRITSRNCLQYQVDGLLSRKGKCIKKFSEQSQWSISYISHKWDHIIISIIILSIMISNECWHCYNHLHKQFYFIFSFLLFNFDEKLMSAK